MRLIARLRLCGNCRIFDRPRETVQLANDVLHVHPQNGRALGLRLFAVRDAALKMNHDAPVLWHHR